MGKDMTFFIFIGMFSGLVAKTKAFRKEKKAEHAFKEYTGYDWNKVNSDVKVCDEFGDTDYAGSEIQELQIEP